MNLAHLHLLLNHFPVIGTIIGLGLYLASFFRRSEDVRRSALIIFAAMGLLSIATFMSGFGAEGLIKAMPGISEPLIQRHEASAMVTVWLMLIVGTLALIGLWQMHSERRMAGWNVAAILVLSLLTMGVVARTSNTGGDIRHPEDRDDPTAPVTEGTIGNIMHAFEPNPAEFTMAMVGSKWWWAFMMDLHFIGLALLIGTIGLLDLRIMGFVKQIPLEPLHRLVPWAMAGLGINVVTGLLAFIGMPTFYAFDIVFWYKMFTILLLGLNAAAFYLTGVFDGVEHLGAGQDAAISAKLIAASSLLLWFVVIMLGRYIQVFEGSIPTPNN